MPIPTCFRNYSSVIELKVRDGDASGSSFIVQGFLANLGLLLLHIKLSSVLSRSVKNCAGIFMRIALNL